MDKLQISQFTVNSLTKQVTVVAQNAAGSISIYTPFVPGEGDLTDQIKASALAQIEALKAAFEAL